MRQRKEIDGSTYAGRFAIRLRQLRDKAGLTTRELSEKTGVPKQTIEGWESGRSSPVIDHFPALAEGLGIKPRTLLPER